MQLWPILDFRELNRYLKVLPFCMLQMTKVLQAIAPGEWFTSINLKDAYFHVPVHPGPQEVPPRQSNLCLGFPVTPDTAPKGMAATTPGGATDLGTVWGGPSGHQRVCLIVLSGSPWQKPVPYWD